MWNEIFLTLLNPSLIQPLNQDTPIYEESFLQSGIEAVRAFLQTRSNQVSEDNSSNLTLIFPFVGKASAPKIQAHNPQQKTRLLSLRKVIGF